MSEVPMVPLKRLAHIRYGLGEPPPEKANGVPFVRATDISAGKINAASVKRVDPAEVPSSRNAFLKPGDVLVVRSGAYTGDSARIPETLGTAVAGYDMVVSPRRIDSKFLGWVLLSPEVTKGQIELLKARAAQPHLNAEELGGVEVPLPDETTQEAIAFFLDRETAKIDTLIEKKQRLLELLEEKRTALITRAVTRGLDPAVPMKDSGVDWIGGIPEHWGVSKVKHVARLESGHTPSRSMPEYWQHCAVPWITLADVGQLRADQVEYIRETKEKVSELGLANSSARRLPSGTVVLSRTASVGFSAIMDGEMATSQDFANWVCGDLIMPEFLLYVFRGMRREFRRLMMGSTHQTIYMPDIRRLQTPVPPIDEQRKIVAHIRSATKGSEGVAEKTRKAIEVLREYRTALISAAVTGNIEVPEPSGVSRGSRSSGGSGSVLS